MKIALNGFGRIGRTFLRCLLADPLARKKISVVAINMGPKMLSSRDEVDTGVPPLDILFAYDTIMGKYPGTVTLKGTTLHIDDIAIPLLWATAPKEANWKQYGAEWVIDASGRFTERARAQEHRDAGAQRVLITAPASGDDITIIPGVNSDAYDPQQHFIISLGSCTTNCFAPIIKVLDDAFGLTGGLMTTVHAYTNDQVLLDVQHHDPRRARAAACNMVPTKTGAERMVKQIFPHLAESIRAHALRVPVPIVSLLDFAFQAKKSLSVDAITDAFTAAERTSLRGILACSELPLVSSDFQGNPHSAIVDLPLTQSTGTLGKVFAWYDNEWGYSERLKDFLLGVDRLQE